MFQKLICDIIKYYLFQLNENFIKKLFYYLYRVTGYLRFKKLRIQPITS